MDSLLGSRTQSQVARQIICEFSLVSAPHPSLRVDSLSGRDHEHRESERVLPGCRSLDEDELAGRTEATKALRRQKGVEAVVIIDTANAVGRPRMSDLAQRPAGRQRLAMEVPKASQ